jgi:hypothetical protein
MKSELIVSMLNEAYTEEPSVLALSNSVLLTPGQVTIAG